MQKQTTLPPKHPMESLSQAIERLTAAGYCDDFRAERKGLRAREAQCLHDPEDVDVEQVVRFEGESNPDDQSMLFALRCQEHGVAGTYAVAFGPSIAPADAEVVRRLPDDRNGRQPA